MTNPHLSQHLNFAAEKLTVLVDGKVAGWVRLLAPKTWETSYGVLFTNKAMAEASVARRAA